MCSSMFNAVCVVCVCVCMYAHVCVYVCVLYAVCVFFIPYEVEELLVFQRVSISISMRV